MEKAFMTSPIGDLTIDSDGLRKAIDEIIRLRGVIKELESKIPDNNSKQERV